MNNNTILILVSIISAASTGAHFLLQTGENGTDQYEHTGIQSPTGLDETQPSQHVFFTSAGSYAS